MTKPVKVVVAITAIVFICFIGRCVYMVACISCTTPAIKTYSYKGTMDDFESDFKRFVSSDSSINCEFSRRGSGKYAARDFIVTINKKPVRHYNLVLYDFNRCTKIDLIEISDLTNKVGGNSLDNAAVKNLYNDFKSNFLTRLKAKGIELKADWF